MCRDGEHYERQYRQALYAPHPSHPLHAEASIAPSHLSGSQDLLARLDLAGAYDRAVRPYLNPKVLAANPPDSSISAQDPKGKGRAVESPGPATAPATIQVNGTTIQEPPSKPAAAAPPEKAKSMKKHYSHLIGDVPGEGVGSV